MDNVRTIENFEVDGVARPINSPRSMEACLRHGYMVTDLLPKGKKKAESSGLPPKLESIRLQHEEEARQGQRRPVFL